MWAWRWKHQYYRLINLEIIKSRLSARLSDSIYIYDWRTLFIYIPWFCWYFLLNYVRTCINRGVCTHLQNKMIITVRIWLSERTEHRVYKITKVEQLTETIYLMDVVAPRVANKCLPGQFVIVRGSEDGERIPLTICDYSREDGTINTPLNSFSTTQ